MVPAPRARRRASRSNCRSNSGTETLEGPVRSRSHAVSRDPSPTRSRPSNSRINAGPAASTSMEWRRSFAPERTSKTSRVNVETPGRRTLRSRSQRAARSNKRTGPSDEVQARASRNSLSSSYLAGSEKSAYPYSVEISAACSYPVCPRCAYSLSTEASAMPSCPARDSTTGHGTANGSVKKRPTTRTVIS
ncbi:hypothetical protein B879_04229 [Cecembia lonarensis LW9]|uniref:Uncharacterized protein n=1 Tax=Cecembia lonarensis (strain CCUG 58316 / KCTC 22772 / LW9) TaxID=1225176 RepID=K1L9V0_CECL9|nr:hypothetical protein B879_04229 [Cecembia lonarensis LW9]